MNPNLGIVLVIVIVLMVLASVTARRELIGQRLRFLLALAIIAVISFGVASQFTDQNKAAVIAIFAALILGAKFRPRHSRYISRRDRRKAIAEFERSGERYDPKKHEIDHVVPFSRGGGNTADNLKVIPKAKNRAKSDRPPWWDVFG
jgi:glucan phosphoethanolaminetransferase (alkaline phosphatase superfamily)